MLIDLSHYVFYIAKCHEIQVIPKEGYHIKTKSVEENIRFEVSSCLVARSLWRHLRYVVIRFI